MKMKPEDYARMEESVQSVLSAQPSITLQTYLAQGLSAMRFRWDALNASRFDICALYSYLNDTHIDTALRRITGTT
jgi:hypothetical protein